MNRKHFDDESEGKERNRVENDKRSRVCMYYVGGRVVVQPVSGQHDDVTLDLKKYSKRIWGDMIAVRRKLSKKANISHQNMFYYFV